VDPGLSVPLVGAFEVVLGAGLLLGRWLPAFLAAAALHLSGTFLVPVLRPDVAFVDGNPLLLSVEGEYVVKNLVLLAATASLALHSLGTQRP
jgi:putative oxidoreductase